MNKRTRLVLSDVAAFPTIPKRLGNRETYEGGSMETLSLFGKKIPEQSCYVEPMEGR